MGEVFEEADEAEEEGQMGDCWLLVVGCAPRHTASLSHLLRSLHGEEFLVRQVVGRDHEEFRDNCRGRLDHRKKRTYEAYCSQRYSRQVKFEPHRT
jgi:hypothetical protein